MTPSQWQMIVSSPCGEVLQCLRFEQRAIGAEFNMPIDRMPSVPQDRMSRCFAGSTLVGRTNCR